MSVTGYWDGYDGKMYSKEQMVLKRCRTLLANMVAEQDRKWWQFWLSRWAISAEPLRNDARDMLSDIDELLP